MHEKTNGSNSERRKKQTRVKIYQVDLDRDVNNVAFRSLEETEITMGKNKIDASLYEEVFNADLDPMGLEEMFFRFNSAWHPLYRGRSMSVSDVVVIESDGIPFLVGEIQGGSFYYRFTDLAEYNLKIEELRERDIDFEAHDLLGLEIPAVVPGAFFCDSFGFEKVQFDERQTHKPEDLLRVVYVEPNRRPFEAEILNDLEHLQKAVDGYIEPIYMDDGAVIVGNEEAKLRGMEGNRHIGGGVLAGPFFVCGEEAGDFRSLTDAEADKYMKLFAEPEQISQQEIEADTGYTIFFMNQE